MFTYTTLVRDDGRATTPKFKLNYVVFNIDYESNSQMADRRHGNYKFIGEVCIVLQYRCVTG